MKRRVIETPAETPVLAPVGLANIPCNLTCTFAVEGRTPLVYDIEDSNDARNFLARLIPTAIFNANPELVLSHITDATQDMYEDVLEIAKSIGVPLPAGI